MCFLKTIQRTITCCFLKESSVIFVHVWVLYCFPFLDIHIKVYVYSLNFLCVLDKMILSAKATDLTSFLTVVYSLWNQCKLPSNVFMKQNQRVFCTIWSEDSKLSLFTVRALFVPLANGKSESRRLYVYLQEKLNQQKKYPEVCSHVWKAYFMSFPLLLFSFHMCLWFAMRERGIDSETIKYWGSRRKCQTWARTQAVYQGWTL